MAFKRIRYKIKQQAERNYFANMSTTDNLRSLKEKFPGEHIPTYATLRMWIQKENWAVKKNAFVAHLPDYQQRLDNYLNTLETKGPEALINPNLAAAATMLDEYCLGATSSPDKDAKKTAIELLLKMNMILVKVKTMGIRAKNGDDGDINLKEEFLKKYKEDPEIQTRIDKLVDE